MNSRAAASLPRISSSLADAIAPSLPAINNKAISRPPRPADSARKDITPHERVDHANASSRSAGAASLCSIPCCWRSKSNMWVRHLAVGRDRCFGKSQY
jgi:hypothetical protein